MVYGGYGGCGGYNNYYRSTNVGYNTTNYVNKKQESVEVPLKPKGCWETIKEMFFPTPPPPPRVLKPKYTELTFSPLAWVKINSFVHIAGDFEITGYGKIEGDTITDIKIIEQVVAGAHATATADATINFAMSIPMDEIHLWNLDWHSHVDFSVFRSKTDTDNYNERYRIMNYTSFPCLVFNQAQDVECAEWFGSDDHTEILTYLPDDLGYTQEEVREIYNQCLAEVEEHVSKKSYVTTAKEESTKSGNTKDTDYITWTKEDWEDCEWDYKECCFVKGDGTVPLSKNAQKRLIKLLEIVNRRKTKQAIEAQRVAPKFSYCAHCEAVLKFEKEQDIGYCRACCKLLFQEDIGDDNEQFLCSNCKCVLDNEDEDEIDTGLCTTCMLESTQEVDKSFK